MCSGKRKTAGNKHEKYIWRYVEDIETVDVPEGKELESFPGYIFTELGEVYSTITRKYLSLNKKDNGDMFLILKNKDGKSKRLGIHVKMAELFLESVPGKQKLITKMRTDQTIK